MKFAIAIPQIFSGPRVDTSKLRSFLTRAEALGYESAWVQEDIVGRSGLLEPVTLLSYAAAATRTIGLGVAVILTLLRNPIQLAKSLATLDQLSGGRLIVGVGLGASRRGYPAFGLTAEKRVARFTEGLLLMKRLWTEERVSMDGQFWKIENVSVEPKPIQKPHPPLWFGGHHPSALKRAVAIGDGFIGAGSTSTAEFKEEVAHLRAFLSEAKRDPANFPIGKRVYLAVDADKGRALTRLSEWFAARYRGHAEMADRVAVFGSKQEVVEGLVEIRDSGAELIQLNPVFDETEQAELLAREIIPAVRSV